MDKFENTMTMLRKMRTADMMKVVKEKADMCICPDCPTYTDCAKNAQELLFCYYGMSFVCIKKEMDCLCPNCPVSTELGLSSDFFCTRGGEATQRWTRELMGKE